MTPKDFFRIIIKILGILFVINSISTLMTTLSYFSFDGALFSLIGVLMLAFLVAYGIFFKTDGIIKFFNLGNGFESERFDFSRTESKFIMELSCAILGFYFITINIPYLFQELFFYFKSNINTSSFELFTREFSKLDFINTILYLLLGLALIKLRKPISKYLTN